MTYIFRTVCTVVLVICMHGAFGAVTDYFLAGTTDGLFDVSKAKPKQLWDGGEVKKVTRTAGGFYLLTSKGIIFTADLVTYETRNSGLPVKTLKHYENGAKSFTQEIQDIKDFEILPGDPALMVCATKEAVFLSRNAGKSWESLGLNSRTTGVKAVSAALLAESADAEPELVVFASHPIYGISYIKPDRKNARWVEIPAGLELCTTTTNPDETSDILSVWENGTTAVYAAQTFRSCLYSLDWQNKTWVLLSRNSRFAGVRDGLNKVPGGIICTAVNTLEFIPLDRAPAETNREPKIQPPSGAAVWAHYFTRSPGALRCAALSPAYSGSSAHLSLCELWLLDTGSIASGYTEQTTGKKGIYVPTHQINYPEKYEEHRRTIKNNKLNMVVVDMKDDYGILRFETDNPLLNEKGRVRRTINLDTFIPQMKEDNVYLIARIVTFKDPVLAAYRNGKYAVKDKKTGTAWKGYRTVRQQVPVPEGEPEPETPVYETVQKEYDEVWVDPYCEEVWEYNMEVARELIKKGFDEIQFDYIRFPTDGVNLNDATYPWQDPGMDKESAIMSFLLYAREHIEAPISIDIYGANGFYRTGARTGQDVEMIARYVDVICPMFYPNHFGNEFLAYPPEIDRPYRIFYYGTFRNSVIARNQVIIRPYTQAFYMRVAYDVKYYNNDYVQRQIFGIRDSLNRGYTYWNNSGRYDDLRPDPPDDAPYPWNEVPAESAVPAKPLLHTPQSR